LFLSSFTSLAFHHFNIFFIYLLLLWLKQKKGTFVGQLVIFISSFFCFLIFKKKKKKKKEKMETVRLLYDGKQFDEQYTFDLQNNVTKWFHS
jgi:multisubunit Na+/H+ antiporter MnhB subunit